MSCVSLTRLSSCQNSTSKNITALENVDLQLTQELEVLLDEVARAHGDIIRRHSRLAKKLKVLSEEADRQAAWQPVVRARPGEEVV